MSDLFNFIKNASTIYMIFTYSHDIGTGAKVGGQMDMGSNMKKKNYLCT